MERAILDQYERFPSGSEESLQIVVVRYLETYYPNVRFCASLGGIRTGIKQGRKAKKTGYRAGFPDLQICEARGGYFARLNWARSAPLFATPEPSTSRNLLQASRYALLNQDQLVSTSFTDSSRESSLKPSSLGIKNPLHSMRISTKSLLGSDRVEAKCSSGFPSKRPV